jgi:hypothetical protein
MPTVYREVEVDVDLDDFDDEEIREEYESRNLGPLAGTNALDLLREIYEARAVGKPYEPLLDQLIYQGLGRII